MPLKNTARPAVSLAAETASSWSAPGQFFAEAGDDEEGVVDPTARPMVVMMFVAKTDTSAISPSSAVSARAMTMAMTASKIGRPAATTVPNTTRRTISASGMPMPSPLARSSFAACAEVVIHARGADDERSEPRPR